MTGRVSNAFCLPLRDGDSHPLFLHGGLHACMRCCTLAKPSSRLPQFLTHTLKLTFVMHTVASAIVGRKSGSAVSAFCESGTHPEQEKNPAYKATTPLTRSKCAERRCKYESDGIRSTPASTAKSHRVAPALPLARMHRKPHYFFFLVVKSLRMVHVRCYFHGIRRDPAT